MAWPRFLKPIIIRSLSKALTMCQALSSPSNTPRRPDCCPHVPSEEPEAQSGSVTLRSRCWFTPTGSSLAGGQGPRSSPFLSPLARLLLGGGGAPLPGLVLGAAQGFPWVLEAPQNQPSVMNVGDELGALPTPRLSPGPLVKD